MRIANLRRPPRAADTGVVGVARLDRRTKSLARRLRPGDIAVVDHVDMDRTSAEALVEAGVVAVVNAAQTTSGRYPNLGPEILTGAGIQIVDDVGQQVFRSLKDGQRIQVDGGTVLLKGEPVARGQVLDGPRVEILMEQARTSLSTQLEAFTANAMEYLRRERDLLFDGTGLPQISTRLANRHVLVVVADHDYQRDLKLLRGYMGEYSPVLVGVEAGADAILEAGGRPDLVVGDLETVSDAALRCGAEVVVHSGHAGRPPGMDRLERLGIDGVPFHTTLTAEDVALLFAHHKQAALIVTAGVHSSLVDYVDHRRSGMASTFLTRLQAGPKIVDATSVSRLYRSRVRPWHLLLLLLAGIAALLVAISVTPLGQEWVGDLGGYWDDVTDWVQGFFT